MPTMSKDDALRLSDMGYLSPEQAQKLANDQPDLWGQFGDVGWKSAPDGSMTAPGGRVAPEDLEPAAPTPPVQAPAPALPTLVGGRPTNGQVATYTDQPGGGVAKGTMPLPQFNQMVQANQAGVPMAGPPKLQGVPSSPPAMALGSAAFGLTTKTPATSDLDALARKARGLGAQAAGEEKTQLKKLDEIQTTMEGAQELETQAAQAQAAKEGAQAGAKMAAAKVTQDAIADVDKQARAAGAKDEAEVDKMRSELRGMKVDPGHYWANKSTGDKVGVFIGMALAGMGQAILRQGGPNPVMQMVDRAIDQDVAAQQDAIANKRVDIAEARESSKGRQARFGDQRQQLLADKVARYEIIDQQLAKDISGIKDQSAVARGEQMRADIQQRVLSLRHEIGQTGYQNQLQALAPQVQVAAAKEEEETRRLALEAKAGKEDTGRVVPGVGVAVSDDAAKKAIELKNGADGLVQGVDALMAIRKKHEGGFSETMNPADAAKVEQVTIQMKMALKQQWQLGVLSDKEYERLDKVIANASAYGTPWSDKPAAELEALKGLVVQNTDTHLRNYGLPGYSGENRYGDVPSFRTAAR